MPAIAEFVHLLITEGSYLSGSINLHTWPQDLTGKLEVFRTEIDRSQSLIGVVGACAAQIYRQKALGVDSVRRTAPYGTLSWCTADLSLSV